jgi:hypothetical protein
MDEYLLLNGPLAEGKDLYYETFHYFCYNIYVRASYFILTTITTVGYGDNTGSNTYEYIFSMCVEFVGLTYFSLLTGTINIMFSGN